MLVACEFTGIVRDAFIARGHEAMSCDLIDSERPGPHYKGDVRDLLGGWRPDRSWDMVIAFPPCTYLTVAANRWMDEYLWYREERQKAIAFCGLFFRNTITHVALENPVGVLSSRWAKPTQIIHPWQFGHPERKRTCLWLRNLPKLQPTNVVPVDTTGGRRGDMVSDMPDRLSRRMDRSRTYEGVAKAMAEQWG